MASNSFVSIADFGVNLGLNDNLTPALIATGNLIRKTESDLKNAFNSSSVIEYQQELIKLKQIWNEAGGAALQAGIQQEKAAQMAAKAAADEAAQQTKLAQAAAIAAEKEIQLSNATNNLNQNSYNNFRAIGQADRITREFASGGLTQGLNGLTMFGNSLTRLAAQEGGFKNALSGLVGAFTGPAGIVLGISAVIGFFEEYTKAVKKAEEENDKFIKSLQELDKNAYKIAGGAQAKLATGEALVGIISDPTKDSEIRKTALAELKNLYSENKEIQDLDIKNKNSFNKDLLTYAINRAATQQVDIENQKNEENKLALLYEQKRIITAKFNSDFINAQAKFDAQGKEIFSKQTIQKGYENQFKIDTAKIDKNIAEAEKSNKKFIEAVTKFPVISKESNKELKIALEDKIALLEWDIKQTEKWADEQIKIHQKIELAARKAFTVNWADTIPEKRDMAKDNIPDWFIKQNNGVNPAEEKINKDLPNWIKVDTAAMNENTLSVKESYAQYQKFAHIISADVTNGLKSAWDALQKGESPLDAIANMFAKIAENIALAVIEADIFESLMSAFPELKGAFAAIGMVSGGGPKLFADGGIVSKPTLGIFGEAGPEAIMPLSKLGNVVSNSFNAGSMNGASGGNNGQFVLRGQDLLLAVNRTQKASNLKGQSISLA